MQVGDKVLAKANCIDKPMGAGAVGEIEGFARLSPYHGREAFVKFPPDNAAPYGRAGWFWVSDLETQA